MVSPAMAAAASARPHSLSRIFSASSPTTKTPKPQPKHQPKVKRTPIPKPPAAVDADADNKLPKLLNVIVKRLLRQHNPDKLVSEFVAASSASSASSHFRDQHRVFEVAVTRLTSLGRLDGVEAILDAQKPFLETSTERFAAHLIRLYGRASMPSHAAAIFRELPAQHQSTTTFNAVLSAYANAGEFDALAAAFQEIPASHSLVLPDVYSYNILIHALCRKPDLSAAIDAVVLMAKNGVSPDNISFNTLLNGFYNNGRMDEAEAVWEMMKERNLEPDVKCYNPKLRCLVAEGRIEDAVAVVEMMEKDGPKPDTVSYNELIRGYCKVGKLEEAKKLYDYLVKNGYSPNKGTYETLLPRLLHAGELDFALKICHELVTRGSRCRVDSSLLQDVVTALVEASRVEEATKLVELGRKKYYPQKGLRMPRVEETTKLVELGRKKYYPQKGLRMPHSKEGNDVQAETGEEESILEEKEHGVEESEK